MRQATEGPEQKTANTKALIEMNNELAFCRKAKQSAKESGEGA
mgnify:CR=1 FL=1